MKIAASDSKPMSTGCTASMGTGVPSSIRRTPAPQRQREDWQTRRLELVGQLAEGEAPLADAQLQLERELRQRAEVESELRAARIASDELDALLREHDSVRMAVDQRLDTARTGLDEA